MNNIGHVIFNYNDTRIINLYTKCAEYNKFKSELLFVPDTGILDR